MRQLSSLMESLTVVTEQTEWIFLVVDLRPKPISPSPSQLTSAINREIHL
ncbi:hypothetical protein Hanom_Chr02g00163821 [Helianthus anomalus]